MNFKTPKIFGIVNITEDSFSDGGHYLAPQKAIKKAFELYEAGADVIDLGAQASSPIATVVTPAIEIKRLEPVINELQKYNIPLSIDSYHSETQRYAITKNTAFLNDIQGFPRAEFHQELAQTNCQLIVMHSVQRLGIANEVITPTENLITNIENFFASRITALINAGITRERIILDPGMGFFLGTNAEASILVLKNIQYFKQKFNLPIFISVSRKSFLRNLTQTPVEEIAAATLATELYTSLQGVDIIRTHDVKALRDALTMFENFYETNL